ncbi:epoxide hydrolase [Niabella sp. CC-SYL272]|uniref:epoxide hydrolase family protein n=1 Tax=Niabella agricola TaxID=2891571 RepID=UPI001F1EDBB8|nr:epoxide hydrolase family protein [Niabella agricola]MCF3111962.1 epoxide hydrolase [Niabella agricola]
MKQPFKIDVPQSVLDDLRNRLAATRWAGAMNDAGWDTGTNKLYLQELCRYWQNDFDWKKQESYLNTFQQFTTTIDGSEIHFIHERGKGQVSTPLLLIHGFPDSFLRFVKLIPLLTQADANGNSFDVVVPSIPGYGFSRPAMANGMNPQKIAGLFASLMSNELGYKNFFVHGGDWGSTIAEQLALHHTNSLLALHLTDIPFTRILTIPGGELSQAEKKYLEAGKQWQQTEGGYALLQSTKPQTLGYALNDSPAGLAAWIIEKFYTWSDIKGDLENAYTKDELLANLTLYWATQTITSAMRLYYETMKTAIPATPNSPYSFQKIPVPAAAAIFPKDMIPAPREFAERFFNIQRWTEMPEGGHFAAWEQPALLANDIRAFARSLAPN